jgi:protein-tyrosine phosphatase
VISIDPLRQNKDRVLTLEGGCNFRDIGGYTTAQGQLVKWGQVFRAGVLSYITERDHDALQALEIRAICDLRRSEERQKEPTRWRGDTAHALHWDDQIELPTLRSYAAQRPSTAEGMFDAMIDLYRGLPLRMHARIHGLLTCIANDRVPVLVHCAAGKDRTGVAIAVLLALLEVPRETIVEDYLLTNEVGNFEHFIRGRERAQLGLADANHPLLAMPEELRRVLFSAHADFLHAAFDAIEHQLGGFDTYVEQTLGIDSAVRERVCARLLV